MAKKEKLDLLKRHKNEYVTPKAPVHVTIGPAVYLTFAGRGAPGQKAFAPAIEALYGMAYTVKFARKAAGEDFKVCPIEGVFWLAGGAADFANAAGDQWRWKLMIRLPEFCRPADLAAARKALKVKGKPGDFGKVKLEKLTEGDCVQVLHVGPYSKVGAVYERMAEFAAAEGLTLHGRAHEIYLSDPRRLPPARLRTILRHPVRCR